MLTARILSVENGAVVAPFRGLLELDSLDTVAAINLADVAKYEADYAEAESLLRSHPRPNHIGWTWNLMATLSAQ
jgi:hypothetical protein